MQRYLIITYHNERGVGCSTDKLLNFSPWSTITSGDFPGDLRRGNKYHYKLFLSIYLFVINLVKCGSRFQKIGSSRKKSHPVEPITAGGLKKKILPTQTITITNLPKYLFQIEKQTISLCRQGNIEATQAYWQHYPARERTSAERSRIFYPKNIVLIVHSNLENILNTSGQVERD